MKYLHFNILQKLTTLVTLFVVSFVSIAFADGHVTLRTVSYTHLRAHETV